MTHQSQNPDRREEITISKIKSKLNEVFLPKNIECDGAFCTGCWKDVVREAITMLDGAKEKDALLLEKEKEIEELRNLLFSSAPLSKELYDQLQAKEERIKELIQYLESFIEGSINSQSMQEIEKLISDYRKEEGE